MKYRKRPIEIQAIRASEALRCARHDWYQLPDWIVQAYDACDLLFLSDQIEIKTLEGTMTARRDDWIICGIKGELYPCRDDIFRETYEAVTP